MANVEDINSYLGIFDCDTSMNDFMDDTVDLFSRLPNDPIAGKTTSGEYDFIDEFLNMDADSNGGIFVDPVIAVENFNPAPNKSQKVQAIKADHDYACNTENHTQVTEKLPETNIYESELTGQSPCDLSDSGISSVSGSPQSDRFDLQSPPNFQVQPSAFDTPSPQNNASQIRQKDMVFDFSDVDFSNILSSPLPEQQQEPQQYDQKQQVAFDIDSVLDDDTLFQIKSFDCDTHSTSSSGEESIRDTKRHKSHSTIISGLPNFTPLILNDEEKRLLSEEGVNLPTDLPLTKYEERVLKKVRRKIRNKKSALASRQKKKTYIDGLEARVKQCTNLNETLAKKVKQLENQNLTLMEQLKRVHDMVKHTSSKTTQATTCVMVLLLSIGLFVAPNYGPFSIDSKEKKLITERTAILDNPADNVGHVNRKVLGHQVASIGPVDENNAVNDFKSLPKLGRTFTTRDDRTLTTIDDFSNLPPNAVKLNGEKVASNDSVKSVEDGDLRAAPPATQEDLNSSVQHDHTYGSRKRGFPADVVPQDENRAPSPPTQRNPVIVHVPLRPDVTPPPPRKMLRQDDL